MSRARAGSQGLQSPSDTAAGNGAVACPPKQDDPVGWQQWWEWVYVLYADGLERYAQSLLRRYGVSAVGGEEPRDLVQGFFWTLMKKNGLRDIARIRDLNAYVFTAFWRYVRGRYRWSTAQRRCPWGGVAQLEEAWLPAAPGSRIEEDPTWVHEVVDHALDTLRSRCPRYAAVIEDMIAHDECGRVRPDLAERLGVAARNVATLKHRARRAFGELFVKALRTFVRDDELITTLQRRFLPWTPVAKVRLGRPA